MTTTTAKTKTKAKTKAKATAKAKASAAATAKAVTEAGQQAPTSQEVPGYDEMMAAFYAEKLRGCKMRYRQEIYCGGVPLGKVGRTFPVGGVEAAGGGYLHLVPEEGTEDISALITSAECDRLLRDLYCETRTKWRGCIVIHSYQISLYTYRRTDL